MSNSAKEAKVKAAVEEWLTALDNGKIDDLVDCCDPDVIMANTGHATHVGPATVREKFAPRMEMADMISTWETESINVDNDLAIVVGYWTVTVTPKGGGESNTGAGRLLLVYREDKNGKWRMLVDFDNNGDPEKQEAMRKAAAKAAKSA